MGWFWGTVVPFAFAGALCGWLFFHTTIGMGVGIIVFGGYGVWLSINKIAPIVVPGSFEFASETKSIVETHYLELKLWSTETSQSWVRLGVTAEEWRKAALSVYQSGIFSTNTVDRKVYDKIKKRFEDIGLIETGGKGGGYVLTRSGSNLFKLLATLPFPYPEEPDSVKMLEYPTQTNAQTKLYEEME